VVKLAQFVLRLSPISSWQNNSIFLSTIHFPESPYLNLLSLKPYAVYPWIAKCHQSQNRFFLQLLSERPPLHYNQNWKNRAIIKVPNIDIPIVRTVTKLVICLNFLTVCSVSSIYRHNSFYSNFRNGFYQYWSDLLYIESRVLDFFPYKRFWFSILNSWLP
jgi:hypothetical protein